MQNVLMTVTFMVPVILDNFDYDDNDDDDAFGGVHHDADDVVVGDDDFEDFLVELIVFPTILLKLHFDVLYCIKRLMQCNAMYKNGIITFPELNNKYFFFKTKPGNMKLEMSR